MDTLHQHLCTRTFAPAPDALVHLCTLAPLFVTAQPLTVTLSRKRA